MSMIFAMVIIAIAAIVTAALVVSFNLDRAIKARLKRFGGDT